MIVTYMYGDVYFFECMREMEIVVCDWQYRVDVCFVNECVIQGNGLLTEWMYVTYGLNKGDIEMCNYVLYVVIVGNGNVGTGYPESEGILWSCLWYGRDFDTEKGKCWNVMGSICIWVCHICISWQLLIIVISYA